MKSIMRGSFVRAALLAVLGMASLCAAQDRIVRSLEAGEKVALRGNISPRAQAQFDQGEEPSSTMLYRMKLSFRPTAAQQADLDALLAAQQDPLSPYYHQWLTPEQYADRFGLSADDTAKVIAWLQARGFTIDETAPSRTYVAFSGSVAQVQSAFGTSIHHFVVNGRPHYANISDPVLPAGMADVVLAIHGLNDFRPKPRNGVRPRFSSNISGNHYLVPDDLATLYDLWPLYNSGIDGSGQKLAVMGQTDLVLSDIATFRSLSGLPASAPTTVLVTGSADPGVVSDDIGEADLDVEWSGGVARKAQIVYVNSKNGAFDSLSFAITHNLAPVITISYGDCEPNFSSSEITMLTSLGQQANAQGQTVVGPSGDSGAADCDYPTTSTATVKSATHGYAVDVPASMPYVTGAGGTRFSESTSFYWTTNNTTTYASAIGYIGEIGWNDTAVEIASGGSISATGGGVSTLFSKPAWQTGAGVPNDGKRDVPDVSFDSSADHDGYLACSQSSCVNGFRASDNTLTVFGGTSAASPVFAGMVTLLNQQTGSPQGNVNPRLYALAATSSDAFHDITSGDNKVPCTAGTKDCPSGGTIGYTAGVGYDLVTGLGSVDAYNLLSEWPANAPSPPNFTVAATLISGSQYSVSVTPVNGFTGTVNLSARGLPTGASATFTPAAVTINSAASQSATLQIANGLGTPAGSYILAVSGSSGNLMTSAGINASLSPGPNFSLTAAPNNLSLTAGTTANVGTSTVTVTALNGFTGTVTLTCSVSATLPGTSCSVPAPGTVNTSGTIAVTVTAPTTRASLRIPRAFPPIFPWTDGSFALAFGLVLAGQENGSKRKKLRLWVLLVLLVIGLAVMPGCGGGGSSSTSSNPTPSFQSGSVTVQGVSGSVTQTTSIIVTIS